MKRRRRAPGGGAGGDGGVAATAVGEEGLKGDGDGDSPGPLGRVAMSIGAAGAAGAGRVAGPVAQCLAPAEPDRGLSETFSRLFSAGATPPAPPPAPRRARARAAPGGSAPNVGGAAGAAGRPREGRRRRSLEEAEETAAEHTAGGKRKRLTEEELQQRQGRTLFLGNVPLAWDQKRVRRALRDAVGDKYSGSYKPIWFRALPLATKWSGKHRKVGAILGEYDEQAADSKNAYVVLATPEAVRVVSRVSHGLRAGPRHVLRADGVGEAAKLVNFDRKRSVFVGGLPQGTAEADLRDALGGAGEVDAVRVVRDRVTKLCKGFAFVRFRERASVKAALALWGTEVQGRPIRVMKVSRPDSVEAKPEDALASPHPAALRIKQRARRKKFAQELGAGGLSKKKAAKVAKAAKATKAIRKDGKREKKAARKEAKREQVKERQQRANRKNRREI